MRIKADLGRHLVRVVAVMLCTALLSGCPSGAYQNSTVVSEEMRDGMSY